MLMLTTAGAAGLAYSVPLAICHRPAAGYPDAFL